MAFDITDDTGQFAFTLEGAEIQDSDWISGTWTRTGPENPDRPPEPLHHLSNEFRFSRLEGTVDGESDAAWLRIFIGPDGDLQLAAQTTYGVYARITDDPETPVIPCGWLTML